MKSGSLLHALLYTAAGDVASAALRGERWSPTWSTLKQHLQWARAGESGLCDQCWIATALVTKFPAETDDRLVETWRGVLWIANSLFADDEIVSATLNMARALRVKTLLSGEDIEAIVYEFDVKGALGRACEGFDLERLLPIW